MGYMRVYIDPSVLTSWVFIMVTTYANMSGG